MSDTKGNKLKMELIWWSYGSSLFFHGLQQLEKAMGIGLKEVSMGELNVRGIIPENGVKNPGVVRLMEGKVEISSDKIRQMMGWEKQGGGLSVMLKKMYQELGMVVREGDGCRVAVSRELGVMVKEGESWVYVYRTHGGVKGNNGGLIGYFRSNGDVHEKFRQCITGDEGMNVKVQLLKQRRLRYKLKANGYHNDMGKKRKTL